MTTRARPLAYGTLGLAALVGCGDLVGLGGAAPPLARIDLEVTGDLAPLRPAGTEGETPRLAVALVWAAQSLPEPACVLPPSSDEATAVIQAGCPDIFGFVPARVGANVEVTPDLPATIELASLPGADVMVGDVTARIAYASLVVYDDRNGSRTLDLQEPAHFGEHGDGPGRGGPGGGDEGQPPEPDADVVYGASFVSMTEPDQRVAFREGVFNAAAAFYPRSGCPDPPPGFSVLSAGGFSVEDAIVAVLSGRLPEEDPALCAQEPLDEARVVIALRQPEPLRQLACTAPRDSGWARYRQPTSEALDLTERPWACMPLPTFGEPVDEGTVQLVVAGRPTDACKSLTHFLLRGCEDDPSCASPEWDVTATPPDGWPCPDGR